MSSSERAASPLPRLVVERLDPTQWRTYRDLRLAALLDSPRAFWTSYAEAAALTEQGWRDRLGWPTWCAYAAPSPDPARPLAPVGLVALWHPPQAPDGDIQLVQMWVASWGRGAGVADALIDAAVQTARDDGWARIVLEVAQDNPGAQRCYRRAGFAATGRSAGRPWDDRAVDVEMARSVI